MQKLGWAYLNWLVLLMLLDPSLFLIDIQGPRLMWLETWIEKEGEISLASTFRLSWDEAHRELHKLWVSDPRLRWCRGCYRQVGVVGEYQQVKYAIPTSMTTHML